MIANLGSCYFIQEDAEDLAGCDFEGFDIDERQSCMEELKKYKSERRRLKREVKKGFISLDELMLDYPVGE